MVNVYNNLFTTTNFSRMYYRWSPASGPVASVHFKRTLKIQRNWLCKNRTAARPTTFVSVTRDDITYVYTTALTTELFTITFSRVTFPANFLTAMLLAMEFSAHEKEGVFIVVFPCKLQL